MLKLKIVTFGLAFLLITLPVIASEDDKIEPEHKSEPLNFQSIFRHLDEVVRTIIEKESLPESSFLGRDQNRAQRDIDSAIENAIKLLDSPRMIDLRANYRRLEQRISRENERIATLRERRQFAPVSDSTTLTRFTPTETLRNMTLRTRGDYDYAIEIHQENIKGFQDSSEEIIAEMSSLLSARGVSLPTSQVEMWLSSVIGDDILTMTVVFNSIYEVTLQLQELTKESGESLEFAKRYYGMMVSLHDIIMTMQSKFINDIDEIYLPQLEQFRNEALQVINESRSLMDSGNRAILQGNIRSNQQTIEVIDLYSNILKEQQQRVKDAHRVSQTEFRVALNTYRTVNLSSQVVSLVADGVDTFEALMNIQVPDSAAFENTELRYEFRKLSERIDLQ